MSTAQTSDHGNRGSGDRDQRPMHTPGPWTLSDGANGEWQITAPDLVDSKGEDWSVAMTFGSVGHEGGNGESDANARLIGSAPDLLAALQAVNKLISEAAMTGFNCHDGDWADRLFQSQRTTSAAIKKAYGSAQPALSVSSKDGMGGAA